MVDWLNLIGSIVASDNKVNSRFVVASPKPDAPNTTPVSALVNLTYKPKRVTKLSLIPSFKLIVSSSDTE